MKIMEPDLIKSHIIKKAAQRSRVNSVKLQKLMKQFREVSIKVKRKKKDENQDPVLRSNF